MLIAVSVLSTYRKCLSELLAGRDGSTPSSRSCLARVLLSPLVLVHDAVGRCQQFGGAAAVFRVDRDADAGTDGIAWPSIETGAPNAVVMRPTIALASLRSLMFLSRTTELVAPMRRKIRRAYAPDQAAGDELEHGVPAAWPKLSLMGLKRSRSMNSRPKRAASCSANLTWRSSC